MIPADVDAMGTHNCQDENCQPECGLEVCVTRFEERKEARTEKHSLILFSLCLSRSPPLSLSVCLCLSVSLSPPSRFFILFYFLNKDNLTFEGV